MVDTGGHLIGIAVAGVEGADIGLAIPTSELIQTLHGRVGGYSLHATRGPNGVHTVHVTIRLIDPLNKVRRVTFHYIPTDALQGKKTSVPVGTLLGGHMLDLKIDGQQATGSFAVTVPEKGETVISFQCASVNEDPKPQITPMTVYHIKYLQPKASKAGAEKTP